jgi:hypothetical protein
VHSDAAAPAYVPALQLEHDVCPALEAKPATHATHCVAALFARSTTQFVLAAVPALVMDVENVTTAPLTADTTRSELFGSAPHVWPLASFSCKFWPTRMPSALLLRVIVFAVVSMESSGTVTS